MSNGHCYEIGIVHVDKHGHRWLAVTNKTLISFKKGKRIKVTPSIKYIPERNISVDELISLWGISLERLDEATVEFMSPPVNRTRPSGPRKRQKDSMDGYNIRFARLLTA